MLGRSNGEVAWRTMGFRLFAGLGISGVIPSVVAVNVERRHNSDHVIYCWILIQPPPRGNAVASI